MLVRAEKSYTMICIEMGVFFFWKLSEILKNMLKIISTLDEVFCTICTEIKNIKHKHIIRNQMLSKFHCILDILLAFYSFLPFAFLSMWLVEGHVSSNLSWLQGFLDRVNVVEDSQLCNLERKKNITKEEKGMFVK